MHLSVFFCLVAAATAAVLPQSYGPPRAASSNGAGLASSHFGIGAIAAGGQSGPALSTSQSLGSGIGAVDVRAGSSASSGSFTVEVEDDDDDDHVFSTGSSGSALSSGLIGGATSVGFSSGASSSGFQGGAAATRFSSGSSSGFSSGSGQASFASAEPELSRNYFTFTAPKFLGGLRSAGPVHVPKQKLIHNIVFVHAPEGQESLEPIVVPPPQHKTLVYVISKDRASSQRVIEVPAGPADNPEVFYINVEEGANPQLPIGIDLRSALAAAANQEGQLISVGAAGAGGLGSAGLSSGVATFKGHSPTGAGAESLGSAGLSSTGADLDSGEKFSAGASFSSAGQISTGAGLNGQSSAGAAGLTVVRGDDDHDDGDDSDETTVSGGGAAQPSSVYGAPRS